MHFVYKLDNLFRSIRVPDKNSSVTRELHFLKLIWTPNFFVFLCTIQSKVINFQHFLTSSAIFSVIYRLVTELNDREIENHYKMISEKVETWHGIIISPTVHVQKSRGLRQKLDALRVQIGQSLSEYQGLGRELICYTGTSMFFKLIWTPDFFCVQYAAFKDTLSISNMFWHHLLFFSHLPNCLES